jgi:hypothetical protein
MLTLIFKEQFLSFSLLEILFVFEKNICGKYMQDQYSVDLRPTKIYVQPTS